jgi:hypothetical protein
MPRRRRPVLGVDYVIDDRGRAEFTSTFLEARGYCCELGCRFCPFMDEADPMLQDTTSRAAVAQAASHRSALPTASSH